MKNSLTLVFSWMTLFFFVFPYAQAMEVGDTVPEVVLREISEAGSVRSEDIRTRTQQSHRFLLLEFFTSSCGACRLNMPALGQISLDIASTTSTRMVSLDRDENLVNEFRQEFAQSIHFPIALDSSLSTRGLFNIRFVPTLFLVDSSNRVIYKHIGTLEEGDQQEIRNLAQ